MDIDDKIEEALNAEGRSRSHVALGLLICLGCVGATAAIAASRPLGSVRSPAQTISMTIWENRHPPAVRTRPAW